MELYKDISNVKNELMRLKDSGQKKITLNNLSKDAIIYNVNLKTLLGKIDSLYKEGNSELHLNSQVEIRIILDLFNKVIPKIESLIVEYQNWLDQFSKLSAEEIIDLYYKKFHNSRIYSGNSEINYYSGIIKDFYSKTREMYPIRRP